MTSEPRSNDSTMVMASSDSLTVPNVVVLVANTSASPPNQETSESAPAETSKPVSHVSAPAAVASTRSPVPARRPLPSAPAGQVLSMEECNKISVHDNPLKRKAEAGLNQQLKGKSLTFHLHEVDPLVKSLAPAIPMWQLPPHKQVERLVRVEPALDGRLLLRALEMLRAHTRAPAAPQQCMDVRDLCRKALGMRLGGMPVRLVQADAASSLGVEGSPWVHWSTWSLSNDSEMVDTPGAVKQTDEDPQFQMWYGSKRGRPVLTGEATAMVEWMLQSKQCDTPLEPFHAVDVVPATSLSSNETHPNGTYRESPNQAQLEMHFAPTTAGFFVDNRNYAAIFPQGLMGARALASQCSRRNVKLTRANEAVYKLFDYNETQVAFTSSGHFGVRFLGGGAQIAGNFPSLGSALAGPASGGGVEGVVSATNMTNIFRALVGMPPVKQEDSPLLALTSGEGRTAAQLARLFKTMDARGAKDWKHPSQIGGAIAAIAPGPHVPSPCAPQPSALRPSPLTQPPTYRLSRRGGVRRPGGDAGVRAARQAAPDSQHAQ